MAATPKLANNLLAELVALVAKVPPEGVALLVQLFRALRASKDPLEAMKRATKAAAAKKLLHESLKRTLG